MKICLYFYNSNVIKYFIIWYDNENNLKKGYIDKWTADMAGIKLEQIYI
jgi:hypothetical protein